MIKRIYVATTSKQVTVVIMTSTHISRLPNKIIIDYNVRRPSDKRSDKRIYYIRLLTFALQDLSCIF